MRKSTIANDDDLLRLMKAGDEEAFTLLYRQRQSAVYRFALQMSGSKTIAEDVTQEVFMALMREPTRYDPSRGSVSTYLYGIARNHVLRCLEQGRVHVPIAEDSEGGETSTPTSLVAPDDPLGDLTRSERVESIRQAVLALPLHYRDVVVLCDLQELSYAETASVLGCAVGTIRSRLNRAHTLLAEKLRATGESNSASQKVRSTRCFA